MNLPSSPKLLRLGLWLAAVLAFVLLVPVAVFSVAPARCAGCHDEAAFTAATKDSSHGDVECVRCHAGTDVVSRIDFGVRQVYVMSIPVFRSIQRDSSVTYDTRCTSCHDKLEGVASRDGIRIAHSTCAQGRSCVDCHGGVAHGASTDVWVNSYTMDLCLSCHETNKVSRDCTSCHEGRREGDRTLRGAWAVTHGADWERTHGMGDLSTCSACHEDSLCAKCHGLGVPHGISFSKNHGTVSLQVGANCESCHRKEYCTDCHGGFEMPHPPGFLQEHSRTADKGNSACLNCHRQEDCDGCHTAHVHPGGALGTGGGSL